MAKRSKTNFTTNVTGQFPTNGTGLIGADRVRAHLGEDIPASFVNVVDDLQLFTTTTGTNAYAITGDITGYVSGYMVIAKWGNQSTGASTLNVNTLGDKKIFVDPTTQANVDDLIQNQVSLLVYDATLDASAGGFLIIGGSGGGSGSLTRVTTNVSGSTPSLNMSGASDRVFVGSVAISADKEFSFSNIGKFVRATLFLTISGSRAITWPANVITDTFKWTWSKPATKLIWAAETGVYRLQFTYDGTSIHLDIYGVYTNVP